MERQRTDSGGWGWETAGAVGCFAGGIGAGLLGSLLTASTWILGAEVHPWIRGLGTALLILTIPLLILAGYCMDWAERAQKNLRPRTPRNEERGSASLCHAIAVAGLLTLVFIALLELHAPQTILENRIEVGRRPAVQSSAFKVGFYFPAKPQTKV